MRMFLTSAALALALAGASLAISTPASAVGIFFGSGSHHSGAAISIGFGNVAFGYRDGYWDSSHRWHRWSNDSEYRRYRGQRGNNYHDWNHDRDSDHGWQRH